MKSVRQRKTMERIPNIWELMEAIYKDGKEGSFIKLYKT